MNHYSFGAIDSNILIYGLNSTSIFHQSAANFLIQTLDVGFVVTPQIILESYNVLVDSKKTNIPLSPSQAHTALASIYEYPTCSLIIPNNQTTINTLALAEKYSIGGQQLIYDCFLACVLLENQIEILYTANISDFSKYPFLKIINPLRN